MVLTRNEGIFSKVSALCCSLFASSGQERHRCLDSSIGGVAIERDENIIFLRWPSLSSPYSSINKREKYGAIASAPWLVYSCITDRIVSQGFPILLSGIHGCTAVCFRACST